MLDQIRIELRFSQRGFSLLYFPKTGLKSSRRGQCLPQSVAPDNVHKAKAREGILQHGIYHFHKGLGVDESVAWGDHFFVEALVKAIAGRSEAGW